MGEVARGLEPVAGFQVLAVRQMFNDFEEQCPTPALWERAFHELLGCFETPEQCSWAFSVMDTDGNGFIDAREFFGALAILSRGHLNDRMALLYDVFDLSQSKEMSFEECFLMLRRTIVGLRKMVGIVCPPEKVIRNMVRQIFKCASKPRDSKVTPEEWHAWWSTDASARTALRMFTWKHDEYRGLPTPDTFVVVDYTRVGEPSRAGNHESKRLLPSCSPNTSGSRFAMTKNTLSSANSWHSRVVGTDLGQRRSRGVDNSRHQIHNIAA